MLKGANIHTYAACQTAVVGSSYHSKSEPIEHDLKMETRKFGIAMIFVTAGVGLLFFGLYEWRSNLVPKTESKYGSDQHVAARKKGVLDGSDISESREEAEKLMGRAFSVQEISMKPSSTSWRAWAQIVELHKMSVERNTNIHFFGKIVDAGGEPLSGVKLKATIVSSETSLIEAQKPGGKSNRKVIEFETDQQGRFEIRGFTGKLLMLSEFVKEGYEIAGESEFKGVGPKKSWAYNYLPGSPSGFVADSDKPEVFVMRLKR